MNHAQRDLWMRRGDSQMWLMSDVFDETSPYSIDAEEAMEHARTVMRSALVNDTAETKARARLLRHLPDTDGFWLDWRAWQRSLNRPEDP